MSLNAESIYPQGNINSAKGNGQNDFVEFDRFRLDLAHLMLYENGQTVSLAPKVIETLLALIERRGEVIGKDELMDRLWADSFVEEANLTQNIYLLRKTLGDSSDGKPLIETFRRRGYRFNGKVADASAASQIDADAQPISQAAVRGGIHRLLLYAAGAAGLAAMLTAIWYFAGTDRETSSNASNLVFTRLTPHQHAFTPSISSDGRFLAYCLFENGESSLWVKEIATGKGTQILPSAPKACIHPRFSRDGTKLYFVDQRNRNALSRVSLAGGEPELLIPGVPNPFAISPDETKAAFVRGRSLVVANLDGSGETEVSGRDGESRWFASLNARPAWSPDGRRIMIGGGYLERGQKYAELMETDLTTGAERKFSTPQWASVETIAWTDDGSRMFVTARERIAGPAQVWQLPYPEGTPARITNDLESYNALSVSSDARQLVAAKSTGACNVWTGSLNKPSEIRQLTFDDGEATGRSGLAVAKDGSVFFTADYSGNLDIWSVDDKGERLRQLTANAGDRNLRQQITDDGDVVVFASSAAGAKRSIWKMNIDGGGPTRLTEGGQDYPSVSPDGKWVYYAEVAGRGSIWRVPIDGGDPEKVTGDYAASLPAVSPDGSMLAFIYDLFDTPESGKIAVLKLDGSGTFDVLPVSAFRGVMHWSRDGKSLFHLKKDSPDLWQQPIDGASPIQLTNFGLETTYNFAISPDGRKIAFSRGNVSTEAVLITNFR